MLPRVREKSVRATDAADFGTLVHHWKETGESDPAWASERDIVCLEKKLLGTGIKREDWWPTGAGRHEVTFAVELYTLRLREYTGPREGADEWKKQFSPRWLTGTIDWLATHNARPWIDDLKTGAWPVHVDTKQLLSYAMYPYAKHAPFPYWTTITQWPKYPLAGLPRRTGRWASELDMLAHLDDLRWAHEHPTEINPTENGCRFCDSKPICPAHQPG